MTTNNLSEQHLTDSDVSCLDCDRCSPNSAAIEICNECCATFFPFFGATEIEFKLLLGKDITGSNVLFNNNDYFSLSSLSQLGSKHDKNNFFVLHLNTRSLTKNHDKIEELLNELNFFPEIISISETKLNPQKTININICNYDFIHNDSPTNAGGVGLYVKNGLKYSMRNDLNLHLSYCEDIWIEVKSTKQSLILSTIYRHPNSDVANFQDKLCDILLKLENNKTSCVINGDFNINLLNTKNNKVKNYTNMLTSVGCNSLINSPTRYSSNCTPSLLDHIYTNISNLRKTSGICLHDISDHLPTFLNIDNFQHSIKNKTV